MKIKIETSKAPHNMEKEIKIPLGNKKYIYGTLRGSLENPLVIFVHGLTGHKNEHQFFNGARFFEKKGFSSFRFDLYSWKEDARKLEDCTLSMHGEDLDVVIEHFRNKRVRQIFVIGHSFGGVTVLLSKKKNFDAAVLWDPSPNPSTVTSSKYLKEIDRYYKTYDTAYGHTIGRQMYEENTKLKPFELIADLGIPVKIIVAGSGVLVEGGNKYFKAAKEPKAFTIIQSATHCFDEDGTEEKLFDETLDWLKAKF